VCKNRHPAVAADERTKKIMTSAEFPDRSTVPALLRAALAGDEAGAAVIVETTDLLRLVFALAAWCNVMHGGADFESIADYDAYLARVQREMAADDLS
jgi:hypothetical protein